MAELDIETLLKNSIILLEYSREKTISHRTIQAAFNICYYDDTFILKRGISEGTKYVTLFTCVQPDDKLKEFKSKINLKKVEKVMREFLHNINAERDNKISLGSTAPVYLAGLIDSFNL